MSELYQRGATWSHFRFPFTYWWNISEIEEQDNQPIIISSNQEQQQQVIIVRRSLVRTKGWPWYSGWPNDNRIYISHWWIFSKSLSRIAFFYNFVVQGTIKTVMTENGEYFNVVVIPSDQVPENYQMGNVIFSPKRGKFILREGNCWLVVKIDFLSGFRESWLAELFEIFFLDETKMEFMPSPMSAAPLTPPASVGKYFCSLQHAQIFLFSSVFSAPVSPEQSPVTEERLSRKRCQNKQSSKRYRQKIKNKEQALFDAVGDLNKVSFFYI